MGPRRFDVFSLVAGLVFAAVAAVYLCQAAGTLHPDARWVAPLELIGLGAGGLAGAVRARVRQRSRRRAASQESAER